MLERFDEAEKVLACTEFGSKECVPAQTEFDSEELQRMECSACFGFRAERLVSLQDSHNAAEWFQHRDLDEVHVQV